MQPEEIKEIFDQQASGYDQQWARMASINNGLYFLLESVFAELAEDAHILCVGAGTGKELIYLARKFPHWQFTVVEPSGAMLDVCRQKVEEEGMTSRCIFQEGYLNSLPDSDLHDAATCFLVSQFILDLSERTRFFSEIGARLKPGGLLASADLASDVESAEYEVLLHAWMNMMSAADITPEAIDRMRKAYANDVGVLPPAKVASIIRSGGFELPVQFFQAGLIHAWLSKRADII